MSFLAFCKGCPSFARSLLIMALLTIPNVCSATLVGPGDVAFIRFNADGTDDFAVVLLADADLGQQVHFNDNIYNPQFNAFGAGEDRFTWNITENLAAGTVVTFTNLSNGVSPGIVSHGSITGDATNTMQLSESGETVYAFLGTSNRSPSSFLGAVSTEDAGVLDGTGLTSGDTAAVLPAGIDEAHYIGSRDTEMTFPDYRALIGNIGTNWEVRLTDPGMIDPPFETTNFTLDSGAMVPESPQAGPVWPYSLCWDFVGPHGSADSPPSRI